MKNEDAASRLKRRLKGIGLSDPAINAAWPTWWSEDADSSASARAELRFSVARKLGLDARSLLEDEGAPRFVWRDEARFKHLAGEGALEKAAITSFGAALGSMLIGATAGPLPIIDDHPIKLRNAILHSQLYVRFVDLLSLCWSIGIPVIHLRIFPWPQKRMSAMAVRVGERSAILLGKDSMYPANLAFYLAHELGHIALGHLSTESAVVDFEYLELGIGAEDSEESDADVFALELLTGKPRPQVLAGSRRYTARQLARAALEASSELRIEPGTLALCFGYSTQDWATANSAMQRIYESAKPAWKEVNGIALGQLALDRIPDDSRSYLMAVLGEPEPA